MERSELIRRLVLNSICDDFENVDQTILRDVIAEGSRLGLTINRPDVVDALQGSVKDGLARAYRLSGDMGPDPFAGLLAEMPPLDAIEEYFETYFYIIPNGVTVHLEDDEI